MSDHNPVENRTLLGLFIKKLRHKRRLSIRKFCIEHSDFDPATCSRHERGLQAMTDETIKRYLEALNPHEEERVQFLCYAWYERAPAELKTILQQRHASLKIHFDEEDNSSNRCESYMIDLFLERTDQATERPLTTRPR